MLQAILLLPLLLFEAKASDIPPSSNDLRKRNSTQQLFDGIVGDVNLKWYPCNETQEIKFECARLIVPLDYNKPENGFRAIIPMVKYPAAKGVPYKGAVLVNPGGPGAPGTEFIYGNGTAQKLEQRAVGPGWDIIGFDPRGVGYSIPSSDCKLGPSDFNPAWQNATSLKPPSVAPQSLILDKRKTDKGPVNTTEPYETIFGLRIPKMRPLNITNMLDELDKAQKACVNSIGAYNQAGPHMNTVVVATDMLSIGKALARERGLPENTTLVNYWGGSYGTLLGQYFATLYPKNVGKFVLDGVVDAESWIKGQQEHTKLIHGDEAWSFFPSHCFKAGPAHCKFYANSVDAIRERFNNLTTKLSVIRDLPQTEASDSAVDLFFGGFTRKIFRSLYRPSKDWPKIAEFLVNLEKSMPSGNHSEWDWNSISDYIYPPEKNSTGRQELDSFSYGLDKVFCMDGHDVRGRKVMPGDQMGLYNDSKLGWGADFRTQSMCTKWSIRPAWEWYGPIGGTTATPILFVGNHYDHVCPYENAFKAATLFKGARALYLEELGHVSLNTENKCSSVHVLKYFETGMLPPAGTRCAEETQMFQ
ncbi:hypothetical protein TWF694_004957 [Orbilia ellipsospora]|uniref:Uncharacterized protein n=1 Tax=Orbilia ellipsospora TaxID=2528407 RepID=A0AAV9WV87_9PEZI